MLDFSQFPTFTFIQDDGDHRSVDLSQTGRAVRVLAERLGIQGATPCRVGLIFRSEPRLVITWLAQLVAGREPIILQYPTAKQSSDDWRRSIRNIVEVAGIDHVFCDEEVAALGALSIPQTIVRRREVDELLEAPSAVDLVIDRGSIIQLSSGTTGHRKPIRFTLEQIRRHVANYAPFVLSGDQDRIVSWLPLYHDMGFVACFLMPLLTKTPVVMMDPMTWNRRPGLLFDAVIQFGGTLCYMPNFGFRHSMKDNPRPCPTMRHWVSCSEPVQEQTMRNFGEAIGALPATLEACYAMAENIFAVTHSRGLVTVEVEGELRVSCGMPIPLTEIKVVEGQVWVRSDTSLQAYVGGDSILDEHGYYPTGDLGVLTDAGLVITGRTGDMLNVAGRKYMLNDLDQFLFDLIPEARGRVTTIKQYSPEWGTERPIFLAEDPFFFRRRSEEAGFQNRLMELSGIGAADFRFVPEQFITKTSSGKANRKATAANLQSALSPDAAEESVRSFDFRNEVLAHFGHLDFDAPAEEVLDSLGLVNLRILAELADLRLEEGMSLSQLLTAAPRKEERGGSEHISVISLADSTLTNPLTSEYFAALSRELGIPVVFEHVAAPPAAVLLNDLIFHDWFMVRDRNPAYLAVERVLAKVRAASVIIIDDIAELELGTKQSYPMLDRRFRRDPEADLLCFRWQKYTRNHHELPIQIVQGRDLPGDRNASLSDLSAYTGAKLFRVATLPRFEEITSSWEAVRRVDPAARIYPYSGPEFIRDAFASWLHQTASSLRKLPGTPEPSATFSDLPHFCCFLASETPLKEVLNSYDRFCVLGSPSSVPLIPKYLTAQGKHFVYCNHLKVDEQYGEGAFDCVLQTGSWGRPETTAPIYQICIAGHNERSGKPHDYFVRSSVAGFGESQ